MGRTDHPFLPFLLFLHLPAPIVADVVLFDLFHKNIITAMGRERERLLIPEKEKKKRLGKENK